MRQGRDWSKKKRREDCVTILPEEWGRMYEWILMLMKYIYGMVCREFRDLKTIRVKHVLRVAAGIEGRDGVEHLRTQKKNNRKEPGEDYARSILEFRGKKENCDVERKKMRMTSSS